MELDQLKESWKHVALDVPSELSDVYRLIAKAKEPVKKIKRRTLKSGLLIIFITGFSVWKLSPKNDPVSRLMMIQLLIFGSGILLYFTLNYLYLIRIGSAEGSVKSNIEKDSKTLGNLLRLRLIFMRSMCIIFCLLLEWTHHKYPGEVFADPAFDNPYLRIWLYTLGFVLFYFLTKKAMARRYGKHILHLQKLTSLIQ